jgi:hypothetical protein
MNIKTNWKQWITAGVVAGAMLLGAVLLAPQATFAQTDDSTGDDTTTQTAPWGRGGMKFGMGDLVPAGCAASIRVTWPRRWASRSRSCRPPT